MSKKGPDGFFRNPQPCPRPLDRLYQHVNGQVLPENDSLKLFVEILEPKLIRRGDASGRNLGYPGHYGLDVPYPDDPSNPFVFFEPHTCTGLVNHIDCLIGQVPVIYVPSRKSAAALSEASVYFTP